MATERFFKVGRIETIAERTCRMTLLGDTSGMRRSGRFVMVSIDGFFLPRPISICDCADGVLTLVVKVVGEGTAKMVALPVGSQLKLLCDIGNGFDVGACTGRALLIGGGVGVAPLLLLARELVEAGREVTAVIGFKCRNEVFLEQELLKAGADVVVATADGSDGCCGLVTDAIAQCALKGDYFYACGPRPMLEALCNGMDIPGEVSLEERMGCGVGICYVCTCNTTGGPARTCKEGPVFKKGEVIW